MQSSLVNNGRGGIFFVEIVKHQKPKPFSFSKSLPTSLPSPFLKLTTPHFFKPTTVTAPLHYLPCTASSDSNIGSTSEGSDGGERSIGKWIEMVGEVLSTAFPVWVALGCFFGLVRPNSFNWVQPQMTIFGITITMLGMGMTLTFDDLRGALAMPKELLAGFVLQYSVMPLSGYFVSKLLKLPSYYAAGLILVGCCPGGTASNIVTYLARGNVALSVLMTAASTLAAVVMTPFLTAKLAGQFVAVDAAGLLISTLQLRNSVLGLVLAAQHFGDPLTAVPCAVSSVCHSIFGSLLAGIWRCNLPKEKQD